MTRAKRAPPAPATVPELTPAERFAAWLADADAPSRHVYWRGHLNAVAGEFRPDRNGVARRFHASDEDAAAVADAALAAEQAGLVLLTQGRLEPGKGFAYVATRRTKPPQGDMDR